MHVNNLLLLLRSLSTFAIFILNFTATIALIQLKIFLQIQLHKHVIHCKNIYFIKETLIKIFNNMIAQ
jgi:hypothetical protein